MRTTALCPRCGTRRQINESREPGMCRDCKKIVADITTWEGDGVVVQSISLGRRPDRLTQLYALRDRITQEIHAELTRRPQPSRRPRAACGTDSGYYRHRRRRPKQDACDACKKAHNAAEAARQRRSKYQEAA